MIQENPYNLNFLIKDKISFKYMSQKKIRVLKSIITIKNLKSKNKNSIFFLICGNKNI